MKVSKLKNMILIYSISSIIAYGSVAFTDYADYQQFRDFAESRGNYRGGNSIIKVPLKDGTEILMTTYGLPDFAATDKNAVGTLVSPTHIVSVAHNGGYTTVNYGGNTGRTYGLIDRNDQPGEDFHAPRLNKVVTEVAPTYVDFSTGKIYDYKNDFSVLVRVGTGTQQMEENGKRTWLAGAYSYKTGGFFLPSEYNWANHRDFIYMSRDSIRDPKNPLHTFAQGGDSGSPIWGYHKEQKRWMLIGVTRAISSDAAWYKIFEKEFFTEKVNEDTLPDIVNTDKNTEFVWQGIDDDDIFGIGNANTGTGYITQGEKKWQYNGLKVDYDINQNNFNKDSQFIKDLNSTKHLAFAGEDGTIKLANSINMGAGMLTFKSNYLVTSDTKDKTWVGAGILVEKDKIVTWEVNGVSGDSLHKVGEGTLIAQGNGDNKGSLNIGDGTVILNQTGGKAFESIDIVSGRGTVKIGNKENATNLDTSKVFFGFRGGKLDVNGFDLDFGDIRATDKGARIVNSDESKRAAITINTSKFDKDSSIYHGQFGDTSEEKGSKMDVELVNLTNIHKSFGITGGVNIDGDILQGSSTTLVLAGEYELPAGKDISIRENGYFYTNKFKFNNLQIMDGSEFQGGVYSDIEGNIEAMGGNKIVLGFVEGETKYMYDLGQDTKKQGASLETLTHDKFKQITTLYKGDITLKDSSKLLMGYTSMTGNIISDSSSLSLGNSILTGNIELSNKSELTVNNTKIEGDIVQKGLNSSTLTDSTLVGKVQHMDDGSSLSLNDSVWNITDNSLTSNLTLNNGTLQFGDSKVQNRTLSNSKTDFNTLETKNITGQGTVVFRMDLANAQADKIIIKDKVNDTSLTVLADNVTGENGVQLGSYIPLIDMERTEKLNLFSVSGDKFVSVGPVKGKLNEDGNIVFVNETEFKKETPKYTSDMTNAALSDFTAKINMIKSQNDLVKDILDEIDDNSVESEVFYRGNFSNRNYESNKFDKFEQNILNNSIGYKKLVYTGDKWSNYVGTSFTYGVGKAKYRGDYTGGLETFSENLFSKFVHRDGYYIDLSLTGTYFRNDINSSSVRKLFGIEDPNKSADKYETFTGAFGLGIGHKLKYGGFKLTTGIDLTSYYVKGKDYRLHDPTAYTLKTSALVDTDDEMLLQVFPKIKAEYEFGLYDIVKLSIFGGVELI